MSLKSVKTLLGTAHVPLFLISYQLLSDRRPTTKLYFHMLDYPKIMRLLHQRHLYYITSTNKNGIFLFLVFTV